MREVRAVLAQKGELDGRRESEWRAIHSKAGCKEQRAHWDYPPDVVQRCGSGGLPARKPASVIVALQDGAALIVFVGPRRQRVPVVLYAGDVLVFEGDVEHAGAHYYMPNTRLHVYLDVDHVHRPPGETWSRRAG